MGPEYVLDLMHAGESNFTSFSGKAKVDFFEGKKKTPFSAQIRIQTDSAIWISVSSGIGIEGARILLTQDSVKYVNRLDKSYFVSDYDFLSTLLDSDIDFFMIQALLTAKDFSWQKYHNLKAKLDNQLYQIESTNRHKLKKKSKLGTFDEPVYYQSLWIDPDIFKIRQIKIKELGKENRKILASYNQYKKVDNQFFPHSMNIELDTENGMRLELVYYKTSMNETLEFPFSISKKYSPIKL